MKLLIPLILFAAFSNHAHAHPGGSKLICKSAKNSGSNQSIEVSLTRSNGIGWFAPIIEMKVNNKEFTLDTPDETNNYGMSFHNSPLKVITVTAEVRSDDHVNSGNFSVVAIPETVRAFDINDQPAVWTLEAEKEECHDENGSAKFQGVIRGHTFINDELILIDTQIMDCDLTYNSGMAC